MQHFTLQQLKSNKNNKSSLRYFGKILILSKRFHLIKLSWELAIFSLLFLILEESASMIMTKTSFLIIVILKLSSYSKNFINKKNQATNIFFYISYYYGNSSAISSVCDFQLKQQSNNLKFPLVILSFFVLFCIVFATFKTYSACKHDNLTKRHQFHLFFELIKK